MSDVVVRIVGQNCQKVSAMINRQDATCNVIFIRPFPQYPYPDPVKYL